MELSLGASNSCKFISVAINYTVTANTVVDVTFVDANGHNILINPPQVNTLTPGGTVISYILPIAEFSIENGIFIAILRVGGNEVHRQAILLHCDIDCCLTHLTHELIECACDCVRCSTTLAKAQKVFLLITSADYSIDQANHADANEIAGFISQANLKYLKAKEICNNSCGCDC